MRELEEAGRPLPGRQHGTLAQKAGEVRAAAVRVRVRAAAAALQLRGVGGGGGDRVLGGTRAAAAQRQQRRRPRCPRGRRRRRRLRRRIWRILLGHLGQSTQQPPLRFQARAHVVRRGRHRCRRARLRLPRLHRLAAPERRRLLRVRCVHQHRAVAYVPVPALLRSAEHVARCLRRAIAHRRGARVGLGGLRLGDGAPVAPHLERVRQRCAVLAEEVPAAVRDGARAVQGRGPARRHRDHRCGGLLLRRPQDDAVGAGH